MRWVAIRLDKKKSKEVEDKLTSLDRRVLEVCSLGANILVIIHKCKVFYPKVNKIVSTSDVKNSVLKLEQMGLLERR